MTLLVPLYITLPMTSTCNMHDYQANLYEKYTHFAYVDSPDSLMKSA